MIEISLYPWEEVDGVAREQAEVEILLDAEYQAWLDELLADDSRSMTGSDPAYERWIEAGAPGVTWSLLDDAGVTANVWPAEYRDDWVGA